MGRRRGRAGRRRRVLRSGHRAPQTLAAPYRDGLPGLATDSPSRPSTARRALFQAGATHPALLRFSRGAGLPEPLPDALGVAIKLPNTHGPGADQDLLLTSSTDRPLLRRLLFPARSFAHGAFSTALPYDLGNDRVVLLLVPAHSSAGRSADGDDHHAAGGALAELRAAAANGLGFELRTARSFGRSRPLATLRIGPPLPAEQTEALRFNPWTTGPGIRPAGWLNLLRDAAYRASQRGRSRETGPGDLFVARMHRRGDVGDQVPESPPTLHRQRPG